MITQGDYGLPIHQVYEEKYKWKLIGQRISRFFGAVLVHTAPNCCISLDCMGKYFLFCICYTILILPVKLRNDAYRQWTHQMNEQFFGTHEAEAVSNQQNISKCANINSLNSVFL